ncbi:hypothetical protein EJ05DRAFT_472540, partial [Pseudovirgaria hyperparasitica]
MTSLYDQSVPILIKYLNNLTNILKKGEAYADEKGIAHETMLQYRLIEDMRPLTYQVQACSNTAKFLSTRVGGVAPLVLDDNEETFAQLHARIARTIEILRSIRPEDMNGKEADQIVMETGMGNYGFTGLGYVAEYAIPNFHFHLSTAYCLLREQGVPIGALDYLAGMFKKI